ncbi:MAG TPA: YfhO family protein [Vicinamibacteria bacterium]
MTRLARAAPALAVVASLLPHARALWPDLTYYFRDFTVTFYPLRALWARELAAGRLAWWNPYVYEGAPVLPVFYPPDLLHALVGGPAFASWLLTLHFPLAALLAYALARDLGLGRAGAFVCGTVFALSGLALSSLNLYVFLQALALTPAVALTLRRAAALGGRWVPAAAVALAVALSTLAVEFVAQAVLAGGLLAAADAPRARGAGRAALAVALGAGLAAVPVAVTLGILGESARGAGFEREVALGNAVHPAALLQALVPDLFGSLSAPVETWWGGRFFSKGFPYLLSLYLGPLALALAATGVAARGLDPRRTRMLLAAAAVALWYALGERAGLAAWVAALPGASSFRFPSKAMLLPVLAAAVLAGAGADRMARGAGWRAFAWASAAAGGTALALAAAVAGEADGLARWAAVPAGIVPSVRRAVAVQGVQVALLAGAAVLLAALVRRGRLPAAPGVALVATLLVGDLAHAGAGMNPQAPAAFFTLLPELAAQRLDALGGQRVFTYGLDQSPSFRRFLAGGTPGRGLWSFFLSRQMLVPYASAIDRVETAHGKDLTSFVPRGAELPPEDLAPERAASLIEPLRVAAVSRVLSLDPLAHPALTLQARVPAGPPEMWIHVYALAETAARLAVPAGSVRMSWSRPAAQEYEVDTASGGALLVRDRYARGWHALLDGRPVPVRRAEGKYRAVEVPPGRHRVALSYSPPGLGAGLAVMAAALVATAALARKPVV